MQLFHSNPSFRSRHGWLGVGGKEEGTPIDISRDSPAIPGAPPPPVQVRAVEPRPVWQSILVDDVAWIEVPTGQVPSRPPPFTLCSLGGVPQVPIGSILCYLCCRKRNVRTSPWPGRGEGVVLLSG